jgi:ketosteroid isomerase-like protein
MLKSFSVVVFLLLALSLALAGQKNSSISTSDAKAEVQKAEAQWNDCILRRDIECAGSFLAEDYFLMIDIEGQPMVKVPRDVWLKNLAGYFIEVMSMDETHISVYGDTAVATLRYSQKAHTAGNRDITGNFMLTDVWIRTAKGWKIAERHSCRAEKLPQSAPH